MKRDKVYPLCDYPCPIHELCKHHRDAITKKRLLHWGANPYNYSKNTCMGFEPVEEDKPEKNISNV